MSDTNDQTADPVQEAQRWVIKLDSEGFCEQDRSQLRQWLSASFDNRKAFHQAKAAWQAVDHWADSYCSDSGDLPALMGARVGTGVNGADCPVSAGIQAPARRTRVAALFSPPKALAASLLLGLLVAGLWHYMPLPEGHYRTGRGEQLTQQLSDGSTLLLNTGSSVEVDYTETERTIVLHKGEAFFSVAHDPNRPFVVYAAEGRVRALGTAFNVYKNDDQVAVTVTEGTVEVSTEAAQTQAAPRQAAESSVVERSAVESSAVESLTMETQPGKVAPALAQKRVTVNQSLVYRDKLGAITERTAADVEKRLAWRRNKLHFDNASLESFVEEFNRYSTNHIVIVDADLKSIRIGGVFKAGDSTAALKALKASFNVESMWITPYLTLLYRKESE